MSATRHGVMTLVAVLCFEAGAATVSHKDMAEAAVSPAARQALAALDGATSDASLATLIRDILADDALGSLTQSILLVEGALRLANANPGAPGDRLLQALAQQPVTIFVRHEHSGMTTELPAYDIGAAARYAIDRRADRGAAREFLQALESGQSLASSKAGNPAGREMAVAQMDLVTLATASRSIEAALPSSPDLAAAATVAALRLEDDALLASVVRHGDGAAAMAALQAAAGLQSQQAYMSVIESAIERDETAAAALNALADRVADDPGLTPLLLARLDQPGTAFAAAAAVARLERPDLAVWVADRLDDQTDAGRAAPLALALSLMHNDVAVRRLNAYLDAPGGLTALKTKIIRSRAPELP